MRDVRPPGRSSSGALHLDPDTTHGMCRRSKEADRVGVGGRCCGNKPREHYAAKIRVPSPRQVPAKTRCAVRIRGYQCGHRRSTCPPAPTPSSNQTHVEAEAMLQRSLPQPAPFDRGPPGSQDSTGRPISVLCRRIRGVFHTNSPRCLFGSVRRPSRDHFLTHQTRPRDIPCRRVMKASPCDAFITQRAPAAAEPRRRVTFERPARARAARPPDRFQAGPLGAGEAGAQLACDVHEREHVGRDRPEVDQARSPWGRACCSTVTFASSGLREAQRHHCVSARP